MFQGKGKKVAPEGVFLFTFHLNRDIIKPNSNLYIMKFPSHTEIFRTVSEICDKTVSDPDLRSEILSEYNDGHMHNRECLDFSIKMFEGFLESELERGGIFEVFNSLVEYEKTLPSSDEYLEHNELWYYETLHYRIIEPIWWIRRRHRNRNMW